ncbi:MAG: helix-turn-helix domain-containing protein [Immundisolibacteraceae bacterium]|nr:helix-turn-helix domain-containing protein [Immundisolibacteraceae bacterium]
MEEKNSPILLSPDKASELLMVSKATLYRWTSKKYKNIPFIKSGESQNAKIFFDKTKLMEWFSEKR